MKALKFGIMFAFVLVFITTFFAFAASYEVQPGDTLSKIANQCNTTIETIVNNNDHHIIDPNLIVAGMILEIPDCNVDSLSPLDNQQLAQPTTEDQSLTQSPLAAPSLYKTHEGEWWTEKTCGRYISRPNASLNAVYGQFGTTSEPPWNSQPCTVSYEVYTASTDPLSMRIRYSKHSNSDVSIRIFINNIEQASFVPNNQGCWDCFTETDIIVLGSVTEGIQRISFITEGQQYGVAEIDHFQLYR